MAKEESATAGGRSNLYAWVGAQRASATGPWLEVRPGRPNIQQRGCWPSTFPVIGPLSTSLVIVRGC